MTWISTGNEQYANTKKRTMIFLNLTEGHPIEIHWTTVYNHMQCSCNLLLT